MKHYSKLTLLASALLSVGLQAAVVETAPSGRYQVTESVSSIVYKSQQTVAELAHPSVSAKQKPEPKPEIIAESRVDAEAITAPTTEAKVVAEPKTSAVAVITPVQVQPKPASQAPVIHPLPLKITPTLAPISPVAATMTEAKPVVNQAVKPQLPLAAVVIPKTAVVPKSPVIPTSTVMPTSVPIHPILNTTAFVAPEPRDESEEPSLFSAISDWFSVKPVKPWQKGTLAKKAMKPGGEVPEFDVFSEKVFAYKQGSIGGNGVGGGGCGCN